MPEPKPPIAAPCPVEIAPRSTEEAPEFAVDVSCGRLTCEPSHGPYCCWFIWPCNCWEKKAESGSARASDGSANMPVTHAPMRTAEIALCRFIAGHASTWRLAKQ